jgi:crossover junction endonuclease MUS81
MEIDDNEHDSTNIPDFDPDKSIIFPAGSYDVVLVLDTREIEAKSSRDNFSEAIRAKGINVETRALRLGDILWIAKRRDGLGGEEDECVLDYVVERKRLDDLCHSIKDGRYTEQCVGHSSIFHLQRLDTLTTSSACPTRASITSTTLSRIGMSRIECNTTVNR